jgi:hypothetical protein
MNRYVKCLLIILIVLFLNQFKLIKENFYGWIPIPTRNFRNIGSDIRGNPVFIGHNKKGTPIFYDKNKRNIGYGNKGYRGPFMLGLFPFLYNYLYN